jgi:Protein of unknown function (DUF2510)
MDTPTPPAGWYKDPSGGARERWWDGFQWQERWRPVTPPPPPPPRATPAPGWYPDRNGPRYWDGQQWGPTATPRAARPPAFWWSVAAAALMIVGGVGPWATALRVVDVSGTHGDGWIVIGAGLIAIAALFTARQKGGAVVALLAALAGVATGAVDLNEIQSRGALVQPGWGIYAVIAGSVTLGIAGLALLARRA